GIGLFTCMANAKPPGFTKVDGVDLIELAVLSVIYAGGGAVVGIVLGGTAALFGENWRKRVPLVLMGVTCLASGVALLGWAYSVFAIAGPGSKSQPAMAAFIAALIASGLGGAVGMLGFAGLVIGLTTRRGTEPDRRLTSETNSDNLRH